MTLAKSMGSLEMMRPIIGNHFVAIVFFMIFLSIILNQSLIQSVSVFL